MRFEILHLHFIVHAYFTFVKSNLLKYTASIDSNKPSALINRKRGTRLMLEMGLALVF